MAIVDNKIIGISGIYYNEKLDRYDIDYLCVQKEYRGNGITEHMFSMFIPRYEDKEIWFEAWRDTWG